MIKMSIRLISYKLLDEDDTKLDFKRNHHRKDETTKTIQCNQQKETTVSPQLEKVGEIKNSGSRALNHLNELFKQIAIEKPFFTKPGDIKGFDLIKLNYRCHSCGILIENGNKQTPAKFISTIINHTVNYCPKSSFLEITEKRELSSSAEEFDYVFNTLLKVIVEIEERYKFVLVEKRSEMVCKVCGWKQVEDNKGGSELLRALLLHVQSLKSPDISNTDVLSSRDEETAEKSIGSLSDVDLGKDKIVNYLNKFLKIIKTQKKIHFTQERVTSCFGLSFTKYECHQCALVISLSRTNLKRQLSKIFSHMCECAKKAEEDKTTYQGDTKEMEVMKDDNQFKDLYNELLKTSISIKESLQFLGIQSCVKCNWKYSSENWEEPISMIAKVLKHLKTQYYRNCSQFTICESHNKAQSLEAARGREYSVLDCVYQTFDLESKIIQQSMTSFFVFNHGLNKYLCRLCNLSLDVLSSNVFNFREQILSHFNFHKNCDERKKESLFEPKDFVFQKTLQKKSQMIPKDDISKSVQFHKNLSREISKFDLAIHATKEMWFVQNSNAFTRFSCSICCCVVSFKEFSPKRVASFLCCHLERPEHLNPHHWEIYRHPQQEHKQSLRKIQSNVKVVGFYGVYRTLDNKDKLIRLSKNSFVKNENENEYKCILCDSDIGNSSDVFEFRYLIWDHINSTTHKDHFPHLQEDLDQLKKRLSDVLPADSQKYVSDLEVGPGSNFAKCNICHSVVKMKFPALKKHICGNIEGKKKLKKDKIPKKSRIDYINNKRFSALIENVLPLFKSDVKYIKIGSIPGYVSCSLCSCSLVPTNLNLEFHLTGAEHIENRGGFWYE